MEVDGQGHGFDEQADHDERRDAWLAVRGIRVLRIRAVLVRDDLDAVLRTIEGWARDPTNA